MDISILDTFKDRAYLVFSDKEADAHILATFTIEELNTLRDEITIAIADVETKQIRYEMAENAEHSLADIEKAIAYIKSGKVFYIIETKKYGTMNQKLHFAKNIRVMAKSKYDFDITVRLECGGYALYDNHAHGAKEEAE